MTSEPVLKVEHLTKIFPGVVAADDICMEVGQKEIHAIVGENGAGKSTLCKMLTGIYKPDKGDIYLFGEKKDFKTAADSREAGIGMVYQERNLVDYLDGAHNVCLGSEPHTFFFLNEKGIWEKADEIRKKLKISIPLNAPVEELGAGEKQLIEIMRAFQSNPKLLILDEPTASLGEGEVLPFLNFIVELKEQTGISIIFISHKLEEVYQIADKITVFADGKSIVTANTKDISMDDCVRAMLRSDKIKPIQVLAKNLDYSEPLLQVESIAYNGKKHKVNFCVHSGEMVGLYGLVGSGRTETMESVYGVRKADTCRFTFAGETLENCSPMDMIRKGMVLTPELRANGIFGALTLVENIGNLFLDKFSSKRGFMLFREEYKFAENVLKKNGVKYTRPSQKITQLSGGNMQKVIIGRSMEVENLKLLIVDEPTVGMDLGAKNVIYQKLRKIVDEDKKSVVFISSELDELIATCDRIYVFYLGDVVQEFKRECFNKMNILTAAVRGGFDSNESQG